MCVRKKNPPWILYLIQICTLHCRRTPLHYYHRRLPLAAYVVLIGQSVTERKPAGNRERARAAPSRLRRSVAGRLAARGEVLLHYRVPLGLHRYGVLLPPLRMPPPRRKPPKQLAFFLSPIQHHVRGKLPLDKSTLYHRKRSRSHTNQNARNLKHTKERLYSRFIRGRK